jgi:hypothetical protein
MLREDLSSCFVSKRNFFLPWNLDIYWLLVSIGWGGGGERDPRILPFPILGW